MFTEIVSIYIRNLIQTDFRMMLESVRATKNHVIWKHQNLLELFMRTLPIVL